MFDEVRIAGGSITLYHIGKRPPRPLPRRHGGSWDRPWLDKPLKKAVFLTPNPGEVYFHDQTPGNLYAYEVPQWVLDEAGGINRWRSIVSEVLIPEKLWKYVKFKGKVSERKYEKMKKDVRHNREQVGRWRGIRPKEEDTLLKNWKGLLETKRPQESLSLMTEDEKSRLENKLRQEKQDIENKRNPEHPDYVRDEIFEGKTDFIKKRFQRAQGDEKIRNPNLLTDIKRKVERNLDRRWSRWKRQHRRKLKKIDQVLKLLEIHKQASRRTGMNLKEQLIKLGYEAPELRDHLRPVLDKIGAGKRFQAKLLAKDPRMSKVKNTDSLKRSVQWIMSTFNDPMNTSTSYRKAVLWDHDNEYMVPIPVHTLKKHDARSLEKRLQSGLDRYIADKDFFADRQSTNMPDYGSSIRSRHSEVLEALEMAATSRSATLMGTMIKMRWEGDQSETLINATYELAVNYVRSRNQDNRDWVSKFKGFLTSIGDRKTKAQLDKAWKEGIEWGRELLRETPPMS